MEKLSIGETVKITGKIMTGSVGTVVHWDPKTEKYLVRIGGATQNYYPASELEKFKA